MDFFDRSIAVVDRPTIPGPVAGASAFWRLDEPLLDADQRVIRGGMWEPQRSWWNLPNFVRLFVAGYGAGKTNIGAKRIIALALQNAPCNVAVVSPTFPIARQTTIQTIAELLQGKQSVYGNEFWWIYNGSTHDFRIRYHGREAHILVYSGDRPLSLRGPNLAAVWIDEPFIQEQEVYEQMVARVRHPQAVHREIALTGTPEQLNWGYDLAYGELSERLDVGFIRASTRSNRALPPRYVTNLEGMFTDEAAKAYIEGEFVNLSKGRVYYAFSERENVVNLDLPSGAELGVGMDFNVNPMAMAMFWRSGSHMHYFDEFELPNADTEYACSVLRESYGQRLQDVYPDASGNARHTAAPAARSDFTYIRQAGFTVHAREANPPRKDRYNAANGKMRPRSGKITLTVSPKCKRLIKYLLLFTHELMNRQEAMSHLLDAFSYPIAYLFPVNRETVTAIKLRGT